MTQRPPPRAPRVHVLASPGLQEVRAGEGVVFDLTVTNLSDDAQTQSVAVEGLPRGWVTVDFDEQRQAYPREQRSAVVTVAVPEGTESRSVRFRVVASVGDERSATDCVLQVQGVEPAAVELPADEEPRPFAPGLAMTPADVSVEGGGEDDAAIRLAVRNVSARETEYALALDGLEPLWFELPARLRVPAGEALDAELRLRPPAAAGSGVYPFVVRASVVAAPEVQTGAAGSLTVLAPSAEPTGPEEPAPSQERATETAATIPPEVVLGPETNFRFGPGEITDQATVTVANQSRLLEGYSVSVDGLPAEWYRLPIRELRLEPGASQEVALRLTPRPGSEHPAGEYPFRVRVTPHGASDAFAEVGGVLSVTGTVAFDARVAPLQAQGRGEQYKVTLRNTGTQPVSLWIEGSDPEGKCRFQYPPPPNLEPGDERVLPVKVGVRRNRFVGDAEGYDFALRVLPAGGESSSARNFDARLTHQPYLTRRMLKWTLIAAFVLIVLGIILTIGPERLGDGSDWFRCRVSATSSSCRPTPPRVPRAPRGFGWEPAGAAAPAVELVTPVDLSPWVDEPFAGAPALFPQRSVGAQA